MNSKFIASTVIALAAMSSASAFAQSNLVGEAANAVIFPVTTSNLTRAQVQNEYFQARKAGNVTFTSEGSLVAAAPAMSAPSAVTRADVRAEAAAWVKTHNAGSDAS